jgi:predicted enzyme related to lactoylglutathione lyase
MSKIVHFEIPVDDTRRATSFYHEVLGWEISQYEDQRYWLVRAGADDELGANGALVERGDLHKAPVVIAAVDDIDDALMRVEKAGGRVTQGKQPIPGMGWAAYANDTEGNALGMFQMDASAGANV